MSDDSTELHDLRKEMESFRVSRQIDCKLTGHLFGIDEISNFNVTTDERKSVFAAVISGELFDDETFLKRPRHA